jgi:hypothetical protein
LKNIKPGRRSPCVYDGEESLACVDMVEIKPRLWSSGYVTPCSLVNRCNDFIGTFKFSAEVFCPIDGDIRPVRNVVIYIS